jgi:hypothetical protein
MVNVLESTLASTYGEVIVNIHQVFLWIRPQPAPAPVTEIYFGETVTREQSLVKSGLG